jgi:D-amino-acid dehydrogenase
VVTQVEVAGYDVVVVGGGVVGATAAYRCVARGARTLLVDARHPGRATDAGAGIVSPETEIRDGSANQVLAQAAAVFHPALVADLEAEGCDTGYSRVGKLIVARDEREAEWLDAYLGILLDPARPGRVPDGIRRITVDEARDAFPHLGDVTAAAWSDHAARLDGRLFAAALLDVATRRGLATSHAPVERIERYARGARGVTGVVVDGRTIATRLVIVAGGAWSPALAGQLGVTLDIAPQRGQIVHLAVDDPASARWPVVNPLAEHYLVAFPGRVVVGATRESGVGFDARTTASGVARVLDDALSVAPGLADATVLEVRVGLRPVAARGYPYLGELPDVPGCFVATGHGPSGLTYGPWSGAVVADAALGEASADLAPFAP